MNLSIFSGRLCDDPKGTMVSLPRGNTFVCKFVIGVIENMPDIDDGNVSKAIKSADFFECLAFDEAARLVSSNFKRGSKILVNGKMKNFYFEDANKTAHYTNIMVASHIEFGDTTSAFLKGNRGRRHTDLSVHQDFLEMQNIYQEMVDNGILCIDESNYFYIASRHFEVPA